ncbi:hypothetical protein ACF1AJ_16175 [Leifsonia sp. NPDC014704]|uniref:hypothetical protein n=1 Tax=Leifsonia sp. NPDC014704 TaxID=3364123 RepID=UPI0036F4A35E
MTDNPSSFRSVLNEEKDSMKKFRVLMPAAMLAGVCVIAASLTGFAALDAEEVNAVDAVAAIQGVAPESLSGLAATSRDSVTAAAATVEGGRVVVPADPTDGLSLGDSVQIGLPFAQHASDATDSQLPGVVAYDNKNGSTTVPLIKADGALQINTVIDNANAPRRYDYPIGVPQGATLTQDANGTVAVVAADGSPLRVFGEAWAKDANGSPVPTRYEVHGSTLTQVVEFSEHTAFPVIADPSTGVYSYNCVLQNGSSYFLKPGTALNTCKGSYLQKYINGAKVQTIALTGYGTPANPEAFGTPDCYIAIGVGLGTLYGPGWLVRFLSGAIGYVATQGLPNITACRG